MREPRALLAESRLFGRDGARWRSDLDDPVELAATYLQHVVSSVVRETHPERAALEALAAAMGQNVGDLGRKLSGARPLPLADLVALAMLIGDPVVEAIRGHCDDPLPEPYRSGARWERGSGRLPAFRVGDLVWRATVRALAARLTAMNDRGTLHHLVQHAHRHETVEALVEAGVSPAAVFVSVDLDDDVFDIVIGAEADTVVRTCWAAASGDLAAVRRSTVAVVEAIGTVGRRAGHRGIVVATMSEAVASAVGAVLPLDGADATPINLENASRVGALLGWEPLARVVAADRSGGFVTTAWDVTKGAP